MPLPGPTMSDFTPTANYATFSSPVFGNINPASVTGDSNQTYTVAQVLSSFILRGAVTAARTDTLPSAAALVAGIEGAQVGSGFVLTVKNLTGATFAVTLAAGSGGTLSGSGAVAAANIKQFIIVLTNVTYGSEAYTIYSSVGAAY